MTMVDVLEGKIRTRGRAPRIPTVFFVGDIEESDLALLMMDRGSTPPDLVKLRDRHHALARAIASGMTDIEAGIVTGYSQSRISILKETPQFHDLVEFYRKNVDAVYADLHERMAMLSLEVLEELQKRLEDESETVSINQLHDIFKSLADRTGHAPVSKTMSLNVNMDLGARLGAARKRAGL